jgi:hypothetical protein
MSGTFIADLRHYLTEDGELIDGPAPARLVAQHLCSIVEAATSVAMVRETHETNVWCRRRPNRKPCLGKNSRGSFGRGARLYQLASPLMWRQWTDTRLEGNELGSNMAITGRFGKSLPEAPYARVKRNLHVHPESPAQPRPGFSSLDRIP